MRLALTTVQAVGELKKQREEIRQQYVLIPRSPSGRYDRIRRQQKRWELLCKKSVMKKGERR